MGSLRGAVVGSIVRRCMIDNFGKALVPELSYFTLFAPDGDHAGNQADGSLWPKLVPCSPAGSRRFSSPPPSPLAVASAVSVTSYWVGLLTQMLIFAILAMSLDILLGYTGMPSFGHAGFSASRLMLLRCCPRVITPDSRFSVLAGLMVGTLLSAAFGLLVSHVRDALLPRRSPWRSAWCSGD